MDELPPHTLHDAAFPSLDRTTLPVHDRIAAAQSNAEECRDNLLWGSQTGPVYFNEAFQPNNEHHVVATPARDHDYRPRHNNEPVPRYDNGLVTPCGNGLLSPAGMDSSSNAATGASLAGGDLNSSSVATWTPHVTNMSGYPSFQDPAIAGGYGFADSWPYVPAASAQRCHDGFIAAHHQGEAFTTKHTPAMIDESADEDEVKEEDETANQSSAPVPALVPAIGTVLYKDKFIYRCNKPRCARKTFSRPAELRRHYETVHVVMRQFWCVEPLCERNAAAGGKPFPRLDKLRDHERQKHRLGLNTR